MRPVRPLDPEPLWVTLPGSRSPRWYLPREPADKTRASLFVYHPVTLRSRAGWEAARLLAGRGVFRLRRGTALLPREVWEAAAHLIPEGGTLAVARANHPGRYVSLVIGERGEPRVFVKVARDAIGSEALGKERQALESWGPLLPPPLYAPRVLEHSEGVLVLEPVHWVARRAPWKIAQEVAYALGKFFQATALQDNPLLGVAHGDCAPWNLLRTRSGWALIDWENTAHGFPPFFDLFHFFVQSSAELRRPTKRSVLEGLKLKGMVGSAIEAYAAGCEIDPSEARPLFPDYLKRSAAQVSPSAPRRALRIRRHLARMLRA